MALKKLKCISVADQVGGYTELDEREKAKPGSDQVVSVKFEASNDPRPQAETKKEEGKPDKVVKSMAPIVYTGIIEIIYFDPKEAAKFKVGEIYELSID